MIPYYVYTRFTPPRKGLIDDIVVDQTGGVNHLRNHGDLSLCVHYVAVEKEGREMRIRPLVEIELGN